MTPIFPELPRRLGVYTLTRLIELRKNTALYEAQQTHVDRAVVLEVLAPGVSHSEEVTFLAQARLRVASSELPHVANVYESLRAEGLWFLTQELPLGRSLAEIAAAGEQLSVPLLCCVIKSAAEMYDLCNQVELNAMPLAPSSIFIEEGGEVHFLSPLVEDEASNTAWQMKALAEALWAVCPRQKAPGLGRTLTLTQWLAEGYEGQLLPWSTIGDTAATILEQLADDARRARESKLSYRLANNSFLNKTKTFIKRWGAYSATCAALIIGLSLLGTQFGLADPLLISPISAEAVLCHQNGHNYSIMRHPVTVAEYHEFLQALEEMSDEELDELMETIPHNINDFKPLEWSLQIEPDSNILKPAPHETPVTGVNYWQALLYAHYKGGILPTANQLQLVFQQTGAFTTALEWSSSEYEDPIPHIYKGTISILIDGKTGAPVPVSDRNKPMNKAGFRLAYPLNKN